MFKKVLLILTVLLLAVGCASTPTNNGGNNETPTGDDPVIINVYTRDSTSGTREAFESGIGLEDVGELTATAVETSGNGDMAAKVGADKDGIGYVSLTTDFAANNLTPLNFEGVEPTVENVLSQDYTLARPFSIATRAKGDFPSEKHEQVVAAFVDFIMNSEEGKLAVEGEGGIVDMSTATPWSELKANHPVLDGDVSDITIRTVGSTSVVKTLTAALEAFKADTGADFKMDHTGSGDGYKRTLGGEKDGANAGDIGFASRNFKVDGDEPQAELDKGYVVGYYCLDAVVVVVNADNTLVDNLTAAQVASVFAGQTSNWADLK